MSIPCGHKETATPHIATLLDQVQFTSGILHDRGNSSTSGVILFVYEGPFLMDGHKLSSQDSCSVLVKCDSKQWIVVFILYMSSNNYSFN